MLDLRLIRRDPDAVRTALARRGDAGRLDEVLDLDEDWRAATAAAEKLRAEQKAASEAIGAAKRAGEDAGPALERMRDMSAQVKALTERARTAEERLQSVLVTLPNLPDPTAAPGGTGIRGVGARPSRPRGGRRRTGSSGRSGSRGSVRVATTSSSPASGSTWSAARGCR